MRSILAGLFGNIPFKSVFSGFPGGERVDPDGDINWSDETVLYTRLFVLECSNRIVTVAVPPVVATLLSESGL
jgi:hypothetical protein